jgi:hypothetical protein
MICKLAYIRVESEIFARYTRIVTNDAALAKASHAGTQQIDFKLNHLSFDRSFRNDEPTFNDSRS